MTRSADPVKKQPGSPKCTCRHELGSGLRTCLSASNRITDCSTANDRFKRGRTQLQPNSDRWVRTIFQRRLQYASSSSSPIPVPANNGQIMHIPEPNAEQLWLHQLLGEWETESECSMGPNVPPIKTQGREVVRLLGKLWAICEGTGNTPDGGSHASIMTLGYDLTRKQFVGSFIASSMAHFWPYVGSLDATGKVLTLESEGPSFHDEGSMAKYHDVIEVLSHEHRTLTASVQNADGSWHEFMKAHYHRTR